MQYQQFLKRSQRVDVGSHPLNFQGHFLYHLNVNLSLLTNDNDTPFHQNAITTLVKRTVDESPQNIDPCRPFTKHTSIG
jgi:hypothetical protein